MAITRAQQVRQMLKEGSKKPVKQAGATNFLGKQEMVKAPKFWLSEPGHVKAKLAYITDEEEKILIDKNLYGSLKGKPNIGPAGLPSLQGGDFGAGGGGNTGGNGNGGGGGQDHGGGGGWNPGAGSPGTTPDGKNKNKGGGDPDDNRQKYNVDKKTVKTGPKEKDKKTVDRERYEKSKREYEEKLKADKAKADKAKADALALEKKLAKEKEEEEKKKAKELSDLGFSLTDKFGNVFSSLKDKNKKFQNKKNVDLANKRAFQKYQDIEQYVDMMDDYGLSAEEIAKGLGVGAVDKGLKASLLGKDSIYKDGLANKFEVASNMAGLDINKFQDLAQGKEFLGSNIGTSIESFRPNLYDVNSPVYGITGAIANKIRPDTQVTVLNTLRKARDYRDLAGTGDVSRDDLDNLRNRGRTQEQIDIIDGNNRDGGDNYVPPIVETVKEETEEEEVNPRDYTGIGARFLGSQFDFSGLADGGIARAGYMDGGMPKYQGGIMDLETGRQQYFLGKLVKKATRAIKKVAKSPIGKAALLYFGGGALGNLAGGSGLGGMFRGAMTPSKFLARSKLSNIFTKGGAKNILFGGQKLMGNPAKNNFVDFSGILGSGGKFSIGKALGLGLGIPTAMDLLGIGKEEDQPLDLGPGIDINAIRNSPYRYLAPRFTGSKYEFADGGRIGYAEGSKEPVAKETMPLLDMDGMEKDYREDGGFVPIGRMERADDVPARLSKNEFVFTADAVRNAGEGDIDKGAEVMYNMMKNLESGGEVSEESQGLDGAREMFQTSQRLEEVL